MKVLSGCIAAWLVLFVVSALIGFWDRTFLRSGCDEPKSRLEYVIPGHQFGCWLHSVPDADGRRKLERQICLEKCALDQKKFIMTICACPTDRWVATGRDKY